MSFIEFLLEYYVWILTVLVVLIIGVIGFMVDAIQSDKKKNNDSSVEGEDTKKLFGKKKKKEDKVELKSLENDEPLVMEESKEGLVNPSLENNVNSANIDSNLNNIVSNNVIDNNNLSNEVQDISTNLESNVNGNMNIGMEQVNVVSNNQGLSRNIIDDIPIVSSTPITDVNQLGIKDGGSQVTMSSVLENNVVPSVLENPIPMPVVDTPVIPNNVVQSNSLDVSNNSVNQINANNVREPNVGDVNIGIPVSNVNQGLNNIPVNVPMVDVSNNFSQNTTALNTMGGGTVQTQPVTNVVSNQTIPNVAAMGQNNNVNNNQMPVNGAVNSSVGVINPSVVTTTVGAEPFNISDMFANNK